MTSLSCEARGGFLLECTIFRLNNANEMRLSFLFTTFATLFRVLLIYQTYEQRK